MHQEPLRGQKKAKKAPQEDPIPESIGNYAVKSRIAKGGMGELFLATDPLTGRQIVIKKIRSDLKHHKIVRDRFINEVKIAAKLFHPSIIPVYEIHRSAEDVYYTMPFVEGKNLKQMLREAIEKERQGGGVSTQTLSLSTMIRIFVGVCQAVAYCHSRRILHRDLKPENILVGNYGQIYILDWGLASPIGQMQSEPSEAIEIPKDVTENINLTRPGKVFGTLPYLPPERMAGKPANTSSEIYSLGVILYQLLTLRMPFHRRSIREYQKYGKYEKPIDILEVAGFRDIPPKLAEIAKKCLDEDPSKRYQDVQDLLADLEGYQEGVPDWVYKKSLSLSRRGDWQLQENVLFSKLISITRSTEIMEWVYLMISKDAFSGNKKLTAEVTLKESGSGIGLLLGAPEPKNRKSLEEGYCLWVGSERSPGVKLFRSNVPIYDLPDISLPFNAPKRLTIEKMDHNIKLFIDGEMIFDYYDHIPSIGTRVGVLCKDMEFHLEAITVYEGSQNAMVGCLAIPDAFLASKDFDRAVAEYMRIAHSFSGRKEGRDATFRAGTTLIEKSKNSSDAAERNDLLERAFGCFDSLHSPTSGPLELLGKSLVYREQRNFDEELKSLELGIRRYRKHPLFHMLEDHINFRLHESAKNNRRQVYHFALITLRHLKGLFANRDTHALIHNLTMHSEPLYFFNKNVRFKDLEERYLLLAIELAFWLGKGSVLKEIYEDTESAFFRDLIKFSLIQLGESKHNFLPFDKLVEEISTDSSSRHFWPILYYLERSMTRQSASSVLKHLPYLRDSAPTEVIRKEITIYEIWALLLTKNYKEAKEKINRYPAFEQKNPESPLFFLNGCLIAAEKGQAEALKHLDLPTQSAFPPMGSLLGRYLKGSFEFKKKWMSEAFYWEKLSLYRQLHLYFSCSGKIAKVLYYENKIKKIHCS